MMPIQAPPTHKAKILLKKVENREVVHTFDIKKKSSQKKRSAENSQTLIT